MPTTPNQEIICPRCGYDLRGAVQSWESACPLAGRCAECGLDFDWREVMREATHPKLFEHQWRKQPIRSLVWTLLTIARPWRFWREVRLAHRLRLRAILAVLLIAALLPAIALFVEGVFWIHRAGEIAAAMQPRGPTWWAAVKWIPNEFQGNWAYTVQGGLTLRNWQPLSFVMVAPEFGERLAEVLRRQPTALLPPLLMPLAYVLVPESLGRATVRPRHLARVTLYSLAFLLLLALLYCALLFGARVFLHFFDTSGRSYGVGGSLLLRYAFWGEFRTWRSQTIYMARLLDPEHVHILAAQLPLLPWWGFACSHYMKLRHAWGVALLLWVVVYLATVLLHVLLSFM